MKTERLFMLGAVALIVAILAVGAMLVAGEIRDSDRCNASGGREVVTGLIVIHGAPVDQYTCKH